MKVEPSFEPGTDSVCVRAPHEVDGGSVSTILLTLAASPRSTWSRRLAHAEYVTLLPPYATLDDPDHPGSMRRDWTVEGDHPSVAGYRRLGELAFRLPE